MPFSIHVIVRRALLLLTTAIAFGFILGCAKKEPTVEEVLAEAEAVSATGRLGEAIAILENYNSAHPGSFAIADTLAFSYIQAGDPATAAMYFSRAAEIDQSQAEYLLLAADAWQNANDPETAISVYQQYLTLRPNDHNARFSLAELYYSLGQADAARDALLQINREAPTGPVQVRIGELFLEGNNLAQAQQWFNSAANLNDEARAPALLGLLRVAVRAKRFADAEAIIKLLDAEFPGQLDQSPIAELRGQLTAWRAQQQAAAQAAAQIAPGQPATAATPGTATPVATNQPATPAANPPRTATKPVPPPAGDAATTVATTTTGTPAATVTPPPPAEGTPPDLNEPGEGPTPPDKEELVAAAERAFEAAEATPPADAAVEPPAEETPAGPRTLFPDRESGPTRATTIPRDYATLLAAAREAAQEGRQADAVKNFQRALARSSADPQVWSELSEAQYQLGEVHMAPTSASEAVRREPDNPRYRLQYLRVLQGSASPTRMIEEMERARRDFPLVPDFALVLARAHRNLGSTRFARRYFEEFLRLAPPSHPEFATVQNELNNL